MKLKFIKSPKSNLQEAGNAERGARLIVINKICDIAKSALESAGYVCKAERDTGFYILPKNGYVAKVILELSDAEDHDFDIAVSNALNMPLSLDSAISEASFDTLDNGGADLLAELLANELTVKDNIVEANIFQNIKNKLQDRADIKAKNKEVKKDTKELLKKTKDLINNAIIANEHVNGNENVSVEIKDSANGFTVLLKAKYLVGVAFGLDQSNHENILVTRIKLGDGSTLKIAADDKLSNVNTFFDKINAKLHTKIDVSRIVKDIQAVSPTGDSKEEADNNTRARLLRAMGVDAANELTGTHEDFAAIDTQFIAEALSPTQYNNAWEKIDKNDMEAKDAFIRFYFYEEANIKDPKKIDSITAGQLLSIATESGDFTLASNPKFAAIVTYAKLNANNPEFKFTQDSKDIYIIKFVESQNIKKFNEERRKVAPATLGNAMTNNVALFYCRDFFDKCNSPKDAIDIYNSFVSSKLSEKTLKEIIANNCDSGSAGYGAVSEFCELLGMRIETLKNLSKEGDTDELKKIIFFGVNKDSVRSKKSLATILTLYKEISNISSNVSAEDDEDADTSSESEVIDFSDNNQSDELKELQKMLHDLKDAELSDNQKDNLKTILGMINKDVLGRD